MEPNKTLPIYKLVINPTDEQSGVSFVALVDKPAIDRNWQAFSEVRKYEFVGNNEKRIISGALMLADLPIYRRDDMGEYYVVFDKQTISNIAQKYFRNGFIKNVNMMHDSNRQVDGVYMIESIIVDKDRGMKAPESYGNLPDGSWFGSFKVDNDEVWNEFIKTGVFNGFSVEGIFEHKYLVDKDEEQIKSVADRLQNLRKTMVELSQANKK